MCRVWANPILKRLASYFDVSADYLLDISEKTTDGDLENELLRVFRSMTQEQKAIFIDQGKAFIRANTSSKE